MKGQTLQQQSGGMMVGQERSDLRGTVWFIDFCNANRIY